MCAIMRCHLGDLSLLRSFHQYVYALGGHSRWHVLHA